jgi:hypothetical protein
VSERALLKAVTRWLDQQPDVWWIKTHGAPYGRAGVPDLLVCVGGKFAALELKAKGKLATRLQELEIARIAAAGGVGHVVHSMDDAQVAISLARTHKSFGSTVRRP